MSLGLRRVAWRSVHLSERQGVIDHASICLSLTSPVDSALCCLPILMSHTGMQASGTSKLQ